MTRGEQETVNNSQRKGSYSINVVQSVARKKEMVDYRVLRTNNPNIRIRGRILRMAPCKDRLWVRGCVGTRESRIELQGRMLLCPARAVKEERTPNVRS